MKFFRTSVVLAVLSVLTLPVYAAETVPETVPAVEQGETVTYESDDKNVIVNVTVPAVEQTSPTVVENTETENAEMLPEYATFLLDDYPYQEDDTTLSAAVYRLFGIYHPRTQTVTEYLADGTAVTYQEYVPGLAGLDWYWLFGAALFAIVLWSLFALIGGLMKHG